jgi:hypothetical protein
MSADQIPNLQRDAAPCQEISYHELKLIVRAQRRLLSARRRRGLPADPRSIRNLRAVECRLRRAERAAA